MLCERRDLDRTAHIESTLWAVVSVAAVSSSSPLSTVAGWQSVSQEVGEGLPCYRPVPVVRGGSWIFRSSGPNSSVPAVAQVVQ